MKKKFLLAALVLFFAKSSLVAKISFDEQWKIMQQNYNQLCCDTKKNCFEIEKYHNPFWFETKNKIHSLLIGNPNRNILNEKIIAHTMVRRGIGNAQRLEIAHLQHCISPETEKLLNNFKDTDYFYLPRECKTFNCSASSLGHLFYTSKIFELNNHNKISTIVEFGGGYGNLARMFKIILPQATIIIFDLPESLALQSLFLNATTSNIEVIIHNNHPKEFQKGAIHLVPVFYMENCNIQPDVFVSTFAISEAPIFVQNKLIAKKFFDATICYIVGQLSGWGTKFEQHNTIIDGSRSEYESVLCQPFYTGLETLFSYELLATKK